MDFTFTEEQLAFQESIKKFLMNELSPELLRELWESETGREPRMWQALAEQGLMALSVPEEDGGLGLTEVDWILLIEQCGYFGLPDPLLDTALVACGMLRGIPDQAFRSHWLGRIAAGEVRVAVGHPFNGLVPDAHVADLLLLPYGDEVHAVQPQAVTLQPVQSLDPSRRLFEVEWRPQDTALTDAKLGRRLWDDALDRGALAASAQLLGLVQRMLDLSIDYTAERKQFGKAIGSFQAVKHHLADVAIQLEFAKPVVYRAAEAVARQLPQRSVYVSQAKLVAAEAAELAARNGIQVHGAMGYTWEMDLQIFMKRAWALDGAWGERAYHKTRVSDYIFSADAQLGAGATFLEQ